MAENTTRRGLAGHVFGCAVAVSMGRYALAAEPVDPMLDLCIRYREQVAIFNGKPDLSDAEMNVIAEATYGSLYDELRERTPVVTSQAGAIEAIRTALAEGGGMGDFERHILTAALGFLEWEA